MALRLITLACLMALLGGCSPEARSYRNPFERVIVTLGIDYTLEYFPCARISVEDGSRIIRSIPVDRCHRFDPPRRMRGVWITDTEASAFLPGAVEAPVRWGLTHDRIWLKVDSDIYERAPPSIGPEGRPGAYAIEFVGRHTTYPCNCGGMVGSPHMVILDSLISLKAIPPPKRMTREELRRQLLAMPPYLPKRPPRWKQAAWLACPYFICTDRNAYSSR